MNWEEVNRNEWSKRYLEEMFKGVALELEGTEGAILSFFRVETTGDCSLAVKKASSEPRPMFELRIDLDWKVEQRVDSGRSLLEAKGQVQVSSFSSEDADDPQMRVICDNKLPPGATSAFRTLMEKLNKAVKADGKKLLHKISHVFKRIKKHISKAKKKAIKKAMKKAKKRTRRYKHFRFKARKKAKRKSKKKSKTKANKQHGSMKILRHLKHVVKAAAKKVTRKTSKKSKKSKGKKKHAKKSYKHLKKVLKKVLKKAKKLKRKKAKPVKKAKTKKTQKAVSPYIPSTLIEQAF